MRDFIQSLYEVGICTFRLQRKSIIAVFFVGKRDDSLRLVVDCRGPNMMAHPPPKVQLSTPGAPSGVSLNDHDHRRGSLDDAVSRTAVCR